MLHCKKHSVTSFIFVAFAALASMVAVSLFNGTPVHAANLQDTITNKTGLYALARCYRDGNIKDSVALSSYGGTILEGDSGSIVSMPFSGGNNLSCSQVLKGAGTANGGSYPGVLSSAGVTMPAASASSSNIDNFLKNMGYDAPKGSQNGKCAVMTYVSDNPSAYPDHNVKVCATNIQGEKVDSKTSIAIVDGAVDGEFSIDNLGGKVLQFRTPTKSRAVSIADYSTWDDLSRAIAVALRETRASFTIYPGADDFGSPVKFTMREGVDRETFGEGDYTLSDDSAMRAISYLSKGGYFSYDDLKLSQDEKIFLLQWYLTNTYKMQTYGCNLDEDKKAFAEGDGYQQATIYKDSSWQQCYVKAGASPSTQVIALGRDASYIVGNSTLDFDGVLSALKEFNGSTLTNPSLVDESNKPVTGPGGGNSSGGGSGGSGDDGLSVCAGGAASLGWIVCPVLSFVGDAVGELYNTVVEEWLTVDAGLLGDGGGAQYAWGVFRNFANILFIIAFAVVILSQITGIGVSNYGIKKILPRLIAVAILTNLSFLICQLAVDISNILGASLYTFFGDTLLSEANNAMGSAVNLSSIATSIVSTVVGAAAGVAAFKVTLAGAAVAAATIKAWLPGIILAFFTVLIGILFFFLLLGVRQAAIIIAVAIAPVAIVCYALPNAKPFFDRWKKIFVALLILFPICGLMMGGGQLATAILLHGSGEGSLDLFSALVAMLVQIVPFFFIPTLLRRSMSGLGDIGARVSRFGAGLQTRLNRGVRNSEFYKEREERARANLAREKLTAFDNRYPNRDKLSKRQLRRRMSLYNAVEKNDELEARAEANRNRIPLGSDPARRQNLVAAMAESEQNNEIGIYEDSLRRRQESGELTDAGLEQEFDEKLAQLVANPDDQAAYAEAAAYLEYLSGSDDGLAITYNSILKSLDQSGDNIEGLKKLARYSRRLDGLYKNKHRSLRSLFGAIAGDEHVLDSKATRRDVLGLKENQKIGDKTGRYSASNYDAAGINGYDEAQFAGASDDQHNRIMHKIADMGELLGVGDDGSQRLAGILAGNDTDFSLNQDGAIINNASGAEVISKADVEAIRTIERNTRDALRNASIPLQGKAAGSLNKMRAALGYDELQRYNSERGTDDGSLQVRGAGAGEFGLPTVESLRGLSEYTDSRGIRHTIGTNADGRRVDTFREGGRTIERTVDSGGAITERILNASGQEIATATITRDGKITYTSGGSLYGGSTGALTRSGERLSGQEATDYRLRAARDGHEQAELWLQNERRQRNGGGSGGIIT